MHEQNLLLIGIFSLLASSAIYIACHGMSSESYKDSEPASIKDTTVSGTSIHFFSENMCSPKCCGKSNYSCNSGCVCLSESQQKALAHRGNNAATQSPDIL